LGLILLRDLDLFDKYDYLFSMFKAMAQHINAFALILLLAAVPISTDASMELHSVMNDHGFSTDAEDGTTMPDASCCSVEIGNSMCSALCAIVDDKEVVVLQSWTNSQISMSSRALSNGVEPDLSLRPPRSHPIWGVSPHYA